PDAAQGGIGFKVSLLMNELAFRGLRDVADEGVIAVLLGSAVSIVVGGVLVSLRARHYRRALPPSPGTVPSGATSPTR
ncbi:Na+/H+ antiporter NhaA, partial [Rhizobium johnstonii]|uniref:Na+/H+ antiporter NhaA n=1 Tax=Rhizobium johnstonii TaxID=3019933 RepID=UPI003F9D3B52